MLAYADVLGAPQVRGAAGAKQQGASGAAATALHSGAEATALPSGAPHTLAARQQGTGAREREVSTALPSRAEAGACVRCSFYLLYWSESEREVWTDLSLARSSKARRSRRGDRYVRALGTRFT
jgi:hypothetical protein